MDSHTLGGADSFVRANPNSDKFDIKRFHHIEFCCGDAMSTAMRFKFALGMRLAGKSDLSTGNTQYASMALQSNDLQFVFSAPYHDGAGAIVTAEAKAENDAKAGPPHPGYDCAAERAFFAAHGLAVRAVCIEVGDAAAAHAAAVANGGKSVLAPVTLGGGSATMAEVHLYGEVRLRFLSGAHAEAGVCLPGYAAVDDADAPMFGIQRLDHAVGNVPTLYDAVNYVANMTGMHSFAEFTAEDVGTVDSGLNSLVLASNNEMVLFPINEPTFGTKRKSQIQTYLEQNDGAGLQHLALKTNDIFSTVAAMRKNTNMGGFDFMPPAPQSYYEGLKLRLGDALSAEQYERIQALGLLADKDDQGILLQIFTKPLGDRPTIFIEIIERIGCDRDTSGVKIRQKGGCGGFGKGNFKELFKSIERYEETLGNKGE